MKRLLPILCLMVVFLLGSCTDREYAPTYTSDHYIREYYRVDTFALTPVSATVLRLEFFHTKKPGVNGVLNDDEIYEWHRKHHDTNYKKERSVYDHVYGTAIDFDSIWVFSDSDYDEAHPAGSSLNDIVRFVSTSPMPYIKSKYKKTYDWSDDYMQSLSTLFGRRFTVGSDYGAYPIDGVLSSLGKDDFQLLTFASHGIGGMGVLEFPTPTLERVHTIGVRVLSTEGEVYEAYARMEW